MNPTSSQRIGIFAMLALVMAATRVHHFALIPDASWAVFFVAGFYLRGSVRWAFPLLMALAVFVDFIVITGTGMNFWSHYCVSPAYWFLVPTHAALWVGGSWLRGRHAALGLHQLGGLVVSLVAAVSLAFLLSNGSFYWMSSQVVEPSLSGWIKNLGDWYLPYLGTTATYVTIAALIHLIATLLVRGLAPHAHTPTLRG